MNHRDWLAELIREHGWQCGAELGVKCAETIDKLLTMFPQLRMIGVDDWRVREGYGGTWDHAAYRAAALSVFNRHKGRGTLLEMTTLEAANEVADGSLDFVFIDADHSESGVRVDVQAWRPKVRAGGVLCGDDAGWPSVQKALYITLPGWSRRGRCWLVVV
jgi:hypothetical protein